MNKSLSFIAIATFVLLYIRGVLGSYDVQTPIITIFINIVLIFLLFAVHFSAKLFIMLLWGSVAVLHNKDALALVDLAMFVYILRRENLLP